MKFLCNTIMIVLVTSSLSFAQSDFSAEKIFLQRYPSAKSEAMGRSFIADNGSPYAMYFNPAGISGGPDISFAGSYNSPYYMMTNAKSYFGAVTWNADQKNTLGFAVHNINFGNEDQYGGGLGFERIFAKYTLSYSHSTSDNFSIGVNINYFQNQIKYQYETSVSSSWMNSLNPFKNNVVFADVGFIKSIFNNREEASLKTLKFSLAVVNISDSKISYYNFAEESKIPSIIRGGMSLGFNFNRDIDVENFTNLLTLEFQEVMNNNVYSSASIGLESRILDLFLLRVGAFTQRIIDTPDMQDKTRIHDFTYGFGLNLVLSNYLGENNPLILNYDFISKHQPYLSEDSIYDSNFGDFVSHNISLGWNFGK